MKNITVIAKTFYPIKNARSLQALRLVKVLAQDYNVTVVTDSSEEKELLLKNIDVVRVSSRISNNAVISNILNNINAYIYPILGFTWSWRVAGLLNEFQGPIITISSPVDSHLVGMRLKKKSCGIQWYSFFSDPWPYSILPKPYRRNYFIFSKLQEHIMKRILKHADSVFFTNTNAIGYIEDKLNMKIEHKSFIIPHLLEDSLTNQLNTPRSRSFVHAGHLTKERLSQDFLKAFKMFLSDSRFSDFRLVFVGKVDGRVCDLIALEGLDDHVDFFGERSFSEVVRYVRGSFATLVFEADMVENPFIPSKLTDIIITNTPVVALTNRGSAVDKNFNQAGFCVPIYHEESVKEMASKITKFVAVFLDSSVELAEYNNFYNNRTILNVLKDIAL